MSDKKKQITLGVLTFLMAAVWYIALGSPDFLFSHKSKNKQDVSGEKNKYGILSDETVRIILTRYHKKSTQHLDLRDYEPLLKITMADVLEHRDPFKIAENDAPRSSPSGSSSQVKKEKAPALTLQGIIWDERAPTALINGEIVGKGDSILGYRVDDVKKDRVVLSRNGRQLVLWEP
ncbi:MAG: hypothetical protein ACOY90_05810 [Candidatus Zhuqueibacterota bacterium]